MKPGNISGFLMINITPVSRIIPTYRDLANFKEVVEMHEVTGEYDLILKFVVQSSEELGKLVNEIRALKGVNSLETIVSYHKIV